MARFNVQGGGELTDSADILTNFTTALYSKFTALTAGVHNDFYNAVNGQLFEDKVPAGAAFPYAVYEVISAPKEKTFTEEFREIYIQLSIFSSASSSAEIKDAYAHATALFDECALTMTGGTVLRMYEINLVTMTEEMTVADATETIRHYAIDYSILIEKT